MNETKTHPLHYQRAEDPVIEIEAVADRGMSMGRVDGKAAFVPYGAPGDRAKIRVLKEKKRHLVGEIIELLFPSPLRVNPPCPIYTECGGCSWQHLDYRAQVDGKGESFKGYLSTRLKLEEGVFGETLDSPEFYGYRNRVGLKVEGYGDSLKMGFNRVGSRHLLGLDDCPIAAPTLRELFMPLKEFLRSFNSRDVRLNRVDLQSDTEGSVFALAHCTVPLTQPALAFLSRFSEQIGVARFEVQTGKRRDRQVAYTGLERLTYHRKANGAETSMHISCGGFVQANDGVNRKLLELVDSLSPLYAGKIALDIFCGSGNFTLQLGRYASKVVGVEGFPPAIADLEHNASVNHLHNLETIRAPALRGLKMIRDRGYAADFALLDPPRQGCGELISELVGLGVDNICYVSCSPQTQTRDLGGLIAAGYELKWVRGADMFPQTAHLEAVALLSRR